VFREVASGAKTDRPQLRRLLSEIAAGDVMMVTRLDRNRKRFTGATKTSQCAKSRAPTMSAQARFPG
jgi:DNA invertase Pin-like site-specific DNA recombinase